MLTRRPPNLFNLNMGPAEAEGVPGWEIPWRAPKLEENVTESFLAGWRTSQGSQITGSEWRVQGAPAGKVEADLEAT